MSESKKYFLGLPKTHLGLGSVVLILSFLIHIGFFQTMKFSPFERKKMTPTQAPIKVSVVSKSKPENKRIIEAPLEKTEAPDDPNFLGVNDHKAKKQQKAKDRPQDSTLDPGLNRDSPKTEQAQQNQPVADPKTLGNDGTKRYQALLPQAKELQRSMKKGYQDYMDDEDLPEGEYIDVNTAGYRLIGYFTLLRKSIAQTLFSPDSRLARSPEVIQKLKRQDRVIISGTVVAGIVIGRDGSLESVKLLKSSGNKVLDEHWLEILATAEPYPPLPEDYEEDQLKIKYTAIYRRGILRNSFDNRREPMGGRNRRAYR